MAMDQSLHLGWAFVVLVTVLTCSAQVEAQPVGKVVFDKDHQPRMNIGQRRNVVEGDRAALRALASLNRKYPRAVLYYVYWTVRLERGRLNKVTTLFARGEGSVRREDSTLPRAQKTVGSFGYGGISSAKLQRVARHGASLNELEKLSTNYSKDTR